MWNPFKKKVKSTFNPLYETTGGNWKCVVSDPDVTTVAGYLDDNGAYHSTKEAALKANKEIQSAKKYRENKDELIKILNKYQPLQYRWETLELAAEILKDPKTLKDFLNTLEDA